MAATAQSFGISIGVNAAFGLLMFFIFSVLRMTKYFGKFYCAKRYMAEEDQEVRPRPLRKGFFAWIGPTWKATEDEVVLVSGVDAAMYLRIFKYAMWFFTLTSLWVLIVVLPVNAVGPQVNIEATASTATTYSTLDKLTMSNIAPKSSRLWLHAVSTWVVSIFAYWLLRRFSRDAVALRLKHLSLVRRGAESHTIVVMDIPGIEAGSITGRIDSLLFFLPKSLKNRVKKNILRGQERAMRKAKALRMDKHAGQGNKATAGSMRGIKESEALLNSNERTILDEPTGPSINPALPPSFIPFTELDAVSGAKLEMEQDHETPEQMVEREYQELFENQVQVVHPVYKPQDMTALCKEYEGLRKRLIDQVDQYEVKMRKGKKIKRKTTRVVGLKYGQWGRDNFGTKPAKVEAIKWYTMRLEELRRQMYEEMQPKNRDITSTAFVTFKTRQAQMVASSTMQHHDQRTWTTTTAPNPSTIIWENLGMQAWERSLRTGLIWAAFIALTLFYLIPVGAVQALVEVQRLQNIPGFKQLLQITFIRALLQSIFPSLVLRIFLLILPLILRAMTKQEGVIDQGVLDHRVTTKYFIFQVITVFIGSFLVGSFFTNFRNWIDDPTQAATILGTAAPLQSIFFLNYIMFNALFSSPLGIISIVPLILYILMSGLAGTDRKRYRIWSRQTAKYGKDVPAQTITILLGTVFSVINPLIAPMTLVYFIITGMTAKYSLLYIQRPAYASGGKMWSQIVDQIITGLIFFQLIMTALLGVRQSYAAILTAILLPITIWVRFSCCKLFRRPLELLSVRAAVDLDIHDQVSALVGDAVGGVVCATTISLAAIVPQQPVEEGGGDMKEVTRQLYMHPGYTLNQEEHEQLLLDAGKMTAILDGKQELQPMPKNTNADAVTMTPGLDPLSDNQSTLTAPGARPARPSYPDPDVDMIGRYDPNRTSNGLDEDEVVASRNGLMGANGHHDSSSAAV